MHISFVVLARIDHLSSILERIRKALYAMGWSDSAVRKVELASEEALVNIIHHGYKEGNGQISVEIVSMDERVEISISDWGPPFNPLLAKQGDLNAPLEEREEGGLGILFMRQYMDEVRYRRDADRNILTLIKKTA
jgi:anti-sigma regulatory factor (Ser/Thr protein kinase)